MKKLAVFVLLSFFLCPVGFSQDIVLKGTVIDSLSHTNLQNAIVYLKRTDDSSLVAFTRAGDMGAFAIAGLSHGTYMMVVNYPGYVTWIDSITIADQSPITVSVYLMTQAHLLEEVVVHQTIMPIRIKGDTTEFLADSFHLQPGATVEDMLRVLPGMSVDAKGRITANGERVENVLVDGEEFFGNDPTIATRNLNKSDIAKVQLYDKKSDKAAITGIDDGVKQKTINLVLKEDAKKGYFGEVAGSSDLNKYYQGKATISRFTSTLQTGALIVADRTGGRGPVSTYGDGDFGTDDGSGEGIPESIQGAAMFNKKFGSLRSSTANNVGYSHLNVIDNNYTENKFILPDTVYYTHLNSSNKRSTWQERLNSKNKFNLDSLTTLTVNGNLIRGANTSNVISDGETLGSDNITLINTSQRFDNSSEDNNTAKAEIYLKHQFNNSGTRFLTVGAEVENSHNTTESYLYNKTAYYSRGGLTGQDIVDQKKTIANQSVTADALVSYVTPISKKLSLNVNYTFNTSNTDQDIRSYENRNGKYDSLNLLYSNHYKFINTSHEGGVSINFVNSKKINGQIGVALQGVSLKQTDLFTDSAGNRLFYNVFPSLTFGWKTSGSSRLTLNYNGGTRQPTLGQLQPLRNNNDPLNIQVGNPGLKPAFTHLFGLSFSHNKSIAGRSIMGRVQFTVIENDFSTSSTIDNQGRRSFQTINVNGDYAYSGLIQFWGSGIKLFNINFTLTVQPYISGRHSTNFVNGIRNTTDVFSFTPMIWFIKPFTEHFPLSIQTTYYYNFNNVFSSASSAFPTRYHTQTFANYLDYQPVKIGWSFSSNLLYNIRQKLSPEDRNTNSILWSVSAKKTIVKGSGLSVIFKVSDIFNQNFGFNRSVSSIGVTENTFETIQRLVMIGLQWKFNKNRNPAQ